jgi:predicted membrane-bound spermidine synthase
VALQECGTVVEARRAGEAPSAALSPGTAKSAPLKLIPLFGFSGLAALVYQVCWQRLLHAAFGVDIVSVTITVSAFMMGLGVGALAGGILADKYPKRILVLFAVAELAIGAFGAVSAGLIAAVADATMQGSPAVVALASFLLLLIPTTLMGATLPMLVAHCLQAYRTVGSSIGMLYFINTLGAAAGAAVTGFVWFHYFGVQATIHAAAVLNFLVAGATLLLLRSKHA